MKLVSPALFASLLLLQPNPGLAKDPITIPEATVKLMKRGKKLERVWIAPGFDGTKGVKLGRLTDETEDFAGGILEYFPSALRKVIRNDSPYTLHLAIVTAKLKSAKTTSSATVQVEGHVQDQDGAIVSAFIAYASETIGGTEQDNAMIAVNTIAFAITKELFPTDLPVAEKSRAVIVPAPTPVQPTPAPIGSSPASINPPPAVPAPASIPAPPEPMPIVPPPPMPVPTSTQPTPPAQPSPVPVISKPSPSPLIPAAIVAIMKRGSALRNLWISPAYDRTLGFSLGEVRYQVSARNDGIDKVLPDALAGISTKEAPCILELHIVELRVNSGNKGSSNANLGVEGRLLAKDGSLMAAFSTRESITGTGDSIDDCRQASRKVVRAISMDLR